MSGAKPARMPPGDDPRAGHPMPEPFRTARRRTPVSYLRARTFRPRNGVLIAGFVVFGLVVIGITLVHVVAAFLR